MWVRPGPAIRATRGNSGILPDFRVSRFPKPPQADDDTAVRGCQSPRTINARSQFVLWRNNLADFKMAGNANSGRRINEKPFRDALMMEIADAGPDHRALRRVARMLLANAGEGKLDAIKELADRVDGKVPQAVMNDGDGDSFRISIISGVPRDGD